jgi:hypothetical protein
LTNLKEVPAGVMLNLAGIGLGTAFAYLVIAPPLAVAPPP